jgi:thermitase
MYSVRSRYVGRLRVVGTCWLLFMWLCLTGVTVGAAPSGPTTSPQPSLKSTSIATASIADAGYLPGEIIVGWQASAGLTPARVPMLGRQEDRADPAWQAGAARLSAAAGLPVLEAYLGQNRARLAVPAGQEWAEIARLRQLPWVAYAEPNHIARAAYIPTDTYYPQQWEMPLISAPVAWDLAMNNSALVAVVDSGLDTSHPEFQGRILPGKDYVIPGNTVMSDECRHGTHVAGLAVAAFNGRGTVGVAPNANIVPLKVLDPECTGYFFDVATAIREAAVTFHAAVINVSIEGAATSQGMQDLQNAVNDARAANAVVVAAAGNTPDDVSYPAATAGVVAVGATDRYDHWASYSSHQSYLALVAPGGTEGDRILSAIPRQGGQEYDYMYGTSMAAPLVSGAVALVWPYWPYAADIETMLRSTPDKVGGAAAYDAAGHSNYLGYGRLNAASLVAEAQRYAIEPAVVPVTTPVIFLLGGKRAMQTVQVPITNPSARLATWRVMVTSSGDWLQVVSPIAPDLGRSTYGAPGILTLQAARNSLIPGDYYGAVEVDTVLGTPGSSVINVHLRVVEPLHTISLPLVARQ